MTPDQIISIITLLLSFGVDPSIVHNVQVFLMPPQAEVRLGEIPFDTASTTQMASTTPAVVEQTEQECFDSLVLGGVNIYNDRAVHNHCK